MSASWYDIRNVTDKDAEISIYDEIGLFGVTAQEFSNSLKSLGNRRLTVRIHSPGGEIFAGSAIYNALRRHRGGVDTTNDGLAASMASVVMMAGEKRSMAENAMFMIHNPWTMTFGEASDLRKEANLMDDLKKNIVSAYAGRTGIGRDKLSAMMDEETWLTAKEAKDLGFVTDITERFDMRNSFERFDISQFPKRPTNFMAKKPEVKEEAAPEAKADAAPEAKAELSVETKAEGSALTVTLDADTTSFSAKIDALTGKLQELGDLIEKKDAEIVAFQAKVAEYEAKADKALESLSRLEASKGLAPASVIVEVPQGKGEQKSLIDIYNEMPEGEERTAFFQKHREELKRFINQAPKAQ